MRFTSSLVFQLLISAALTGFAYGQADPVISGELKKWHKVTLTFEGPQTSETATPNPFADYRLNVTFTNGSATYLVPGYYAADGDAGNSSAAGGNKWKVHFAPDAIGTWTYTASFRSGTNIAVNANATAGASAGFMDGKSGTFTIAATDKSGRDLRGKGRLKYVGEHYLQFAETKEYFLKQGADAPENLLAYNDFDNTPNVGSRRKAYAPHVKDWKAGDPTWKGDKGKGLIGAVNYLASEGLNVFSFLTYNIGGDDENVFMYTKGGKDADRFRFDCSKLDQWEVVFEHGNKMGMYLHFKTQETENDDQNGKSPWAALDGGNVGNERKMYYRELIARYSHHLALNWNLGEENTQSTQQQKDMAQYFYDNDPYRHNVVLHTYPSEHDKVYNALLGNASKLTGLSLQLKSSSFDDVPISVNKWVRESAKAGKKWVVAVDEPGDASAALRPDDDAGNSHEDGRKNALWGTFMHGGAGNEWYFGYKHAHSDLTLEDFRSRDKWWDYCRYALEFFYNNKIPFHQMVNDNSKSSSANSYTFYKQGESYVVYLKNGGTTTLDLTGTSGPFLVRWYDPRNGGALKNGSVTQVNGGGKIALGNAPSNPGMDWVISVVSEASTRISGAKISAERADITLVNKSMQITLPRAGSYVMSMYRADGALLLEQPFKSEAAEKISLTLPEQMASDAHLVRVKGENYEWVQPLQKVK